MLIVADDLIPLAERAFQTLGEVRSFPSRALTRQAVAEADLLFVRSTVKVHESLLAGSRVRFVASATAGLDHVDQPALARLGIAFAHAPGSNAASVADYVCAALAHVAASKGISLAGKTLGVIGCGQVGGRLAARAAAFGLHVLPCDPPLARSLAASGGDASKYRPLAEVLDQADIITLHTPLTDPADSPDPTRHLANAAFFARLRRGVIFINTCRGEVVDEAALREAHGSGRLAAVIADVFEGEPRPAAATLALCDLATPHIAGHSIEGKLLGTQMIYEAACRFLGVAPTFHIRDHMAAPPAIAEEVLPTAAEGDPAQVLAPLLWSVCGLAPDDRRLREAAAHPTPEERRAAFESSRKAHGPRREFTAYEVQAASVHPRWHTPLRALGFTLR